MILLLIDLLFIGILLWISNSIVFDDQTKEIEFIYRFRNKRYKYRITEIKGFSLNYNYGWANSKNITLKAIDGSNHGIADIFTKNFKEFEDRFFQNYELLALPNFEPLTEDEKKFHISVNTQFDMEQKRNIIWHIKFFIICSIAQIIGIFLIEDINLRYGILLTTFLSMSLTINSIFRLKEKNSA